MATITSHTLNGVDGSHASGLPVTLINCETGAILFETAMDAGGRLSQEVDVPSGGLEVDLVFKTELYWNNRGITGFGVIDQIVLRCRFDGPDDKFHMPVILSPHSYSTWKSA